MTTEEKAKSRKNIIRRLRSIKKEAYYSLTCREHDAIAALIDYLELKGKESDHKGSGPDDK